MKPEKIDYTPEGCTQTPYARARQAYVGLIGSTRARAAGWQRAFFVSMAALIVAIAGLIYQSGKAKVTPYVVEVDKWGEVRVVGKAESSTYTPRANAIKHFLSQFVTGICSVPTDPVVMRKNFLNAYNFVTAKGKNTLDAYARARDPFSQVGKLKVAVDIRQVLKVSDTTYQVEWTEKAFGANGTTMRSQGYSGIFEIKFKQPRTEKLILANPLGIFIDFFNISKRLS